jgi:signal transduction histidine kinase
MAKPQKLVIVKRPPLVKRKRPKPKLDSIPFTVDSAILRELGERLVGQPHIALAELIKNSYDADATKTVIKFSDNHIEVLDNGHGMNFKEFKRFWMRIGSPHKQTQKVSRKFKRPVTGSKGVGRLAVQFLGTQLQMRTVSEKAEQSELQAFVNWDEAVHAGDLTKAVAKYQQIPRISSFPNDSKHGTAIVLSGLNQTWTSEQIVNLARAVWWLQPPFRSNPRLKSDEQKAFTIELQSPDPAAVKEFDSQMRAYLDIWYARLVGRLKAPGNKLKTAHTSVELSLEFKDEPQMKWVYQAPGALLSSLVFEIRVFKLKRRLRYGIQVDQARKYLNEHGGVHVYDAGFHLPYYGVEHDWLDIEIDHSHRLSRSKLLPDSLQVPEGMNFLPTQSRLFGVVHVDTSAELQRIRTAPKAQRSESLQIQISRDRLVDNEAYRALRTIVRTAIDFYAMQEAKRALEEAEALRPIERATEKFQRVDTVLENFRQQIPQPIYTRLRDEVKEAIEASQTEAELLTRQVGLLGSLATAGISALAYEHEVNVQMHLLEGVVDQLEGSRRNPTRDKLGQLSKQLREWIERAKSTRALFSPLLNEENRTAKGRFKARVIVEDVKRQILPLARGVEIITGEVEESLRLPEAGYPEWTAIFQNLFLNAINAMLDSRRKEIVVSSSSLGRERSILVQDTGSGVDLNSADELFKPFIRKQKISQERRELGLGGTGLGLTIVRMIATNLDCKVRFVEPEHQFKTAFQLSWKELK